jgi:hypothetical protein
MKNRTLFLMLAFCTALFGCSNAAKVDAFLIEYKNASDDMAKSFMVADYSGARSNFETKKESLRSQCLAVKDNVGDKKKWVQSFLNNIEVIDKGLENGGQKTDIPTLEKMVALAKELGSICKS